MSTYQRSPEQFHRYTAEQLAIAQHHGLQFDTPPHVARMACVNPQELMLNPPAQKKTKRGSKKSRGSSSRRGTGTRSLDYVATQESLRMEEARNEDAAAEHVPKPIPLRPHGCVRVPQIFVPEPSQSVVFSNYDFEGVPQTSFEELDGIDGCNDPIVLGNGTTSVIFVIAWPGYKPYEFTLDLRKQDESTYLAIKRPICRSELATDILHIFTGWFHRRAMELEGPECDDEVPTGWKIRGGFPHVRLHQIWLTKFGPMWGGDGSRWVAEFIADKGGRVF